MIAAKVQKKGAAAKKLTKTVSMQAAGGHLHQLRVLTHGHQLMIQPGSAGCADGDPRSASQQPRGSELFARQ